MRLWPQTIVGRTVLVLLLGLTASQLIGMAFYSGDRSSILAISRGRQTAERIAAAVGLFEQAPAAERRWLERSFHGLGLRVRWTPHRPLVAADGDDWRSRLVRSALDDHLDDGVERRILVSLTEDPTSVRGFDTPPMGMSMPGMGMHMTGMMQGGLPTHLLLVSVGLADGSWLNFMAPSGRLAPFWSSRFFFSIVVTAVVVIALSVWAVRRSTAPLALFARAAERLGKDVGAPPLDEGGPREVRRAARAFNEMQRRLRDFIDGRTRMLGAISHDLRTPITRLKLRAEFVEDAEQRAKMLADLDEMETMIAATLSFARDAAAGEPRKTFDLAVLLQSLCDAAADVGGRAEYAGDFRFPYDGRPVALKRVFANLIDNALKYGGRAVVSLSGSEAEVTVTVDDDGPGIPEDAMERVFDSFYRLEGSRSRDTGGVGLGLNIARTIVHAHGGKIELANRQQGGLSATVTIPRG